MSAPRVSAVVPTLGGSPWLAACLEALRRQSAELEIVVVCPRRDALPGEVRADQIVETGRRQGFAAATNAGWRRARGEWLAAVNDDVQVEPGWLAALLAESARHPHAAALQGVNLRLDDPGLADGCGLAWNRWLQAVQIGHLQPAPAPDAPGREIFGVSATAAIYRRAALESVALASGDAFDAGFGSYYEDVDLAVRLRAAGHSARLAPAARARHAGGSTGSRHPLRRARLVYGNRLLALRRALGPGLWPELPVLAARDCLDAARTLARGEMACAWGIGAGWARAILRLPSIAAARPCTTAAALREWAGPR